MQNGRMLESVWWVTYLCWDGPACALTANRPAPGVGSGCAACLTEALKPSGRRFRLDSGGSPPEYPQDPVQFVRPGASQA